MGYLDEFLRFAKVVGDVCCQSFFLLIIEYVAPKEANLGEIVIIARVVSVHISSHTSHVIQKPPTIIDG